MARRLHSPAASRTVTTVLAASAGNDMLHSAFSLLCARPNLAHTQSGRAPGEHARDIKVAREAA